MDNENEENFSNNDEHQLKRSRDEDDSRNKKLKCSPRNPNKISKAELYKPPTVEELNQLRETEILFNSNLFRLQTEELLKEITIKQKVKSKILEWINHFKQHLNKIEEIDISLSNLNLVLGQKVTQIEKGLLMNILKNNPLNLKTDQDSKLKFMKPAKIHLIGLHKINATCEPNVNVTLCVKMPKACFHEKDYLNARYIVKKSLYLSHIVNHFQNSKIIENIFYTFLNGNYVIPAIQIKPKDIKRVVFNLVVTADENTFKFPRFLPDKSNLRITFYDKLENVKCPNNTGEMPTPFYNAVILHDLTMEENESFRQNKLNGMKGVCDGLILLTTWLRQRELSCIPCSFTDDLMYSYVTYLVHIGRINKHMSSYQVIRNVWTNLVNSSWDTNGIILSENNANMSVFHEHYDVVFIDKTGFYNFAANLNRNIYLQVKLQAVQALYYLDEGKFNSFEALFMRKMPFYLQYDALINVFEEPKLLEIYKKIDYSKRIDYLTYKCPLIVNHICNILKEGLTDRIISIIPWIKSPVTWPCGKKMPKEKLEVTLGVSINQAKICRSIEKGPQAYEPGAKKFREFWGYKSDLRRFKDGTICEAVHWPTKNLQDTREIFRQIVMYVLRVKLSLTKINIVYDQFDFVFKCYTTPSIDEANLKIVNTFDDLGKKIRSLTLPLIITSIQGISDAFSHSDAFPAVPMNYNIERITFAKKNNIYLKDNFELDLAPKFVAPVEGIIMLGVHSKWPNDILAIQHLIMAFYIQVKEQLWKQFSIKSSVKSNCLEVLYLGLVFRFTIFHPKQIILLKKEVNEKGYLVYRDTDESLYMEQKYAVLPKVTGALNGLHSQHPNFGLSTILIKRWLNCQLIDASHVPNIVLSLLNASLFMNSAPYTQPAMPQIAFLRFLKMLATFDFNSQPVVVNFNEELTKEQLSEMESKFQQNRALLPHVYIITPYDDMKSVFTQKLSSKEVFNRLNLLAKQCIHFVESNVYTQSLIDVMPFFKSNLSGYNVIIHLKPLLNPRRFQNIFLDKSKDFARLEYEDRDDNIPVTDFDPVSIYLDELRENYSDFAVFFHDTYGGNEIGVLWKPASIQEEDFKVSNSEGRCTTSEDKLKTNIEAIIEDFYIMGSGIVSSIETN